MYFVTLNVLYWDQVSLSDIQLNTAQLHRKLIIVVGIKVLFYNHLLMDKLLLESEDFTCCKLSLFLSAATEARCQV